MKARNNPDPMNLVSVHLYSDEYTNAPALMSIRASLKKPLYVGEFGVPGAPSLGTTNQFSAFISAPRNGPHPAGRAVGLRLPLAGRHWEREPHQRPRLAVASDPGRRRAHPSEPSSFSVIAPGSGQHWCRLQSLQDCGVGSSSLRRGSPFSSLPPLRPCQ